MFRELASLGEINVQVNDSGLPAFSSLEPEDSYLSWEIELTGDASKDDVQEIFEWVDDDCDLSIEALAAGSEDNAQQPEQELKQADEVPADSEPAQQAEAAPPQAAVEKEATQKSTSSAPVSTSIRVSTEKIDSLINLVGELVITQSMLSQVGDNFQPDMLPQLIDGLAQLERNTREMQEGIMQIRMLPISFAFNRFPRLVHDLSIKTGKKS
jgi:two-component system chemotaxis sensor kinase CheA